MAEIKVGDIIEPVDYSTDGGYDTAPPALEPEPKRVIDWRLLGIALLAGASFGLLFACVIWSHL